MRKFILLTEIHHIQSLLLESRVDVLKSKFQDKLVAKLGSIAIPSDIRSRIIKGDEFDPDLVFELFASSDPDPTKKNLQWILNTFVAGRLLIEELEKIPDYLTRFAEKKKKRELPPEHMDWNRFRSLGELFAA